MNVLQFYYTHTVLGISSIIQPKKTRTTYRLHCSSAKQTDFLFFCNKLKTKEEKTLIQKIAKALDSSDHIIVEILNTQSSHTSVILGNLLTRFLPRGFVIFGSDLAFHLMGKNNKNSDYPVSQSTMTQEKRNNISVKTKPPSPNQSIHGKITEPISISQNQNQLITGCVLNVIDDFTDPDSTKTQERKKQAWKILRQVLTL